MCSTMISAALAARSSGQPAAMSKTHARCPPASSNGSLWLSNAIPPACPTPLVADYESTREQAYLTRAVEIAKGWVADDPLGGRTTSPYAWAEHPIALRAPALVCLSRHVTGKWLTDSLSLHAKLLSDPKNYEDGHNQGSTRTSACCGSAAGTATRRGGASL
jgi:hypothetical protein